MGLEHQLFHQYLPIIGSAGGNYNLQSFTTSFSLYFYSSNLYTNYNYNVTNNNLVDIVYSDIYNYLYVLGSDLTIHGILFSA
jgi:hypothetical protein